MQKIFRGLMNCKRIYIGSQLMYMREHCNSLHIYAKDFPDIKLEEKSFYLGLTNYYIISIVTLCL